MTENTDYIEIFWTRKREYLLGKGTLTIRISNHAGPVEKAHFELAKLNSVSDTIFVRDELLLGILSCMVLLAIILGFVAMPSTVGISSNSAIALLILSSAVMVLVFAFPRKIEFQRFRYHNEPAIIAFDVGRVGPNAGNFPAFVQRLCEEIEAAKRSASQAAHSGT